MKKITEMDKEIFIKRHEELIVLQSFMYSCSMIFYVVNVIKNIDTSVNKELSEFKMFFYTNKLKELKEKHRAKLKEKRKIL